ncbi:MAG: DNA double-strand break repair nuclease NurA, partial [Okeania sp. SIO2D1]|nr:DNA double-strand break repair nuclease NurA [Okeania sp. SIO2D1]
MLDLAKLAGQLPQISQHLSAEAQASNQRLIRAKSLLEQAQNRQQELLEIQQLWRDRLIFNVATPTEPLDTHININLVPNQHSVFATDGSQISPSHHEVAYCYLINVGRVMLHYGQSLHPLLDSLPEIFYKPEDLYACKQWGIRTEEWMGYRRTVSEVQILAEMACRWVNPPGSHQGIPNLAMVDGYLIYWFLEGLPTEAREHLLPPIFTAWEQLRETGIPFMGYLSASRSNEASNFLRLETCPYEHPDCTTHCSNSQERL